MVPKASQHMLTELMDFNPTFARLIRADAERRFFQASAAKHGALRAVRKFAQFTKRSTEQGDDASWIMDVARASGSRWLLLGVPSDQQASSVADID